MSIYLVPGLDNRIVAISGVFTVSDSTPDSGDDITFTFVNTSINFSYTANDYSISAPSSLVLTASESLTYQLRRNGVDISGATNAVNTIENVDVFDIGLYTLLVTDTSTGKSKIFGPLNVTIPALAIGTAIIGSTLQVA